MTKYVIEKDGVVLIGPQGWRRGYSEIASTVGLAGNLNAPETPYELSDGRILSVHVPDPVTPPDPTAIDVQAQAYRRIVLFCPEWRQRNLTAQAVILQDKGRDNWTAEELAAWNAGKAIWDVIAAIRAKSNEIEAMDPIPLDYTNDSYWS
jgi:hypothetical protein